MQKDAGHGWRRARGTAAWWIIGVVIFEMLPLAALIGLIMLGRMMMHMMA